MPSSGLLTAASRRSSASRFGQHEPGMAAHHLRLAGRQVELAAADVDPHVADAGHQVGVAREAEPGDVEQCGQLLVGNAGVDVLEDDDVADVLGGPIVLGHDHSSLES